MFKINETVVHKTHGIGKVISIETRDFENKRASFYVVEIYDNGGSKKVFCPLENASERIRKVISKADAERIITYIAFGKSDELYYREYMELIHTNDDAMNIAKVYVALKQRNTKDLSFGERKLMDQAYQLLTKEIEVALKETLSVGEARTDQRQHPVVCLTWFLWMTLCSIFCFRLCPMKKGWDFPVKKKFYCNACEDGEFSPQEECQECFPHEYDHYICMYCEHKKCPGDDIDAAEYLFDPER